MNGGLVIDRHRLPVNISAVQMIQVRCDALIFGTPETPTPSVCASCGAPACYEVDRVIAGPELVVVYTFCGECGKRDAEPFD